MTEHTKYRIKAKKLNEALFGIIGQGCFTLSRDEIAVVLMLIEQKRYTRLKNYYEELCDKHMY